MCHVRLYVFPRDYVSEGAFHFVYALIVHMWMRVNTWQHVIDMGSHMKNNYSTEKPCMRKTWHANIHKLCKKSHWISMKNFHVKTTKYSRKKHEKYKCTAYMWKIKTCITKKCVTYINHIYCILAYTPWYTSRADFPNTYHKIPNFSLISDQINYIPIKKVIFIDTKIKIQSDIFNHYCSCAVHWREWRDPGSWVHVEKQDSSSSAHGLWQPA